MVAGGRQERCVTKPRSSSRAFHAATANGTSATIVVAFKLTPPFRVATSLSCISHRACSKDKAGFIRSTTNDVQMYWTREEKVLGPVGGGAWCSKVQPFALRLEATRPLSPSTPLIESKGTDDAW